MLFSLQCMGVALIPHPCQHLVFFLKIFEGALYYAIGSILMRRKHISNLLFCPFGFSFHPSLLKLYSNVVWSKFLLSFYTKCLKQTFQLESHALQFMEIFLNYLFGNYSTKLFSENHSLSKTSIVSMLAFWNIFYLVFSSISHLSLIVLS